MFSFSFILLKSQNARFVANTLLNPGASCIGTGDRHILQNHSIKPTWSKNVFSEDTVWEGPCGLGVIQRGGGVGGTDRDPKWQGDKGKLSQIKDGLVCLAQRLAGCVEPLKS